MIIRRNRTRWGFFKKPTEIGTARFNYVFSLVLFLLFLAGGIGTLAALVQAPAWVEIYTHGMCEYLYDDATSWTACSIEGCETIGPDIISTGWHFWLYGQIPLALALALFAFFAGYYFIMVIWSVSDLAALLEREKHDIKRKV